MPRKSGGVGTLLIWVLDVDVELDGLTGGARSALAALASPQLLCRIIQLANLLAHGLSRPIRQLIDPLRQALLDPAGGGVGFGFE